MNKSELAKLRTEYSLASLCETEVDADPMRQFEHWLEEAIKAKIPEPNAMTLATVSADGRPSARTVLLKEIGPRGFVFFTHHQSRKGRELAHNPYASLLFHWAELERQVRIEGMVEKTDDACNDAYFQSRPLASKISAWAYQHSTVIVSRAAIEARAAEFAARFGENPPRPPAWGGYRLLPDSVEFWQGRPARLHDRIQYRRQPDQPDAGWRIVRLG